MTVIQGIVFTAFLVLGALAWLHKRKGQEKARREARHGS